MSEPLPIQTLLEEWLKWAAWITSPDCDQSKAEDFIGHSEFICVVEEHPEHAWQAILAAVADPRHEPYLGNLAAGPLEALLSLHGEAFIGRVELEAKANPTFALTLGGVWRHAMSDEVVARLQKVRSSEHRQKPADT